MFFNVHASPGLTTSFAEGKPTQVTDRYRLRKTLQPTEEEIPPIVTLQSKETVPPYQVPWYFSITFARIKGNHRQHKFIPLCFVRVCVCATLSNLAMGIYITSQMVDRQCHSQHILTTTCYSV